MAERGTVNYSIIVRREGERLLECLKDSTSGIISCIGWDGIGRWRIAEYAANLAMESHLFDVLIWVNLPRNELISRQKVQKKIAERLGIHSPTIDVEGRQAESETDIHTAVQIYEKLNATKFLLVVGGTSIECEHADLARLGVPSVRRRSSSVSQVLSKIVLIGKWKNIEADIELNPYIESTTPYASDLWDLICEEAALAAHSPSTKGYFSPDTAVDCLLYFSLCFHEHTSYYDFLGHKEWLIRYWIAEELIGGAMEEEAVLLELANALQMELQDRSIMSVDNDFMKRMMGCILLSSMLGRVPNFHHGYWVSKYLPKEDDGQHGWGSIQRMSLFITGKKGFNLPPSPKCPSLSTLILRYEPTDPLEFPANFFDHIENLRVLDLAYTPIRSLPSSVSSLRNLKLLMLRNCRRLESLPASLKYMKKLEFLNLSCCDSLQAIPDESFELMERLQILDFSKTRITSLPSSVSTLHKLQQLLLCWCSELTHIPEKCFERMSSLHVLDLSSATSLMSLPSSLSNLVSLKGLNLSKCISLKTGLPLQSLQKLSLLEVLDLSECESLEDIRDASFQYIPPGLREVHISRTQIPHRLSFRSCQSIETLDLSDLLSLEVLDLSGTNLKTLHLTTAAGYSLKRLDILPKSNVLFQGLNWRDDDAGARIWVVEPDFFLSTFSLSERDFEAPCFSRFYIRISPHEGSIPVNMEEIQSIHLQRRPVVYKGIYHSHTQTHLFPYFTSRSACRRQLEIGAGNRSPRGVDELLAHADLITLLFNNTVERLSDLCPAAQIKDLKECRIGSCQRMENIFSEDNTHSNILRCLEVIWASDLRQLTVVCDGVYGDKSFEFLKHIYLEHCPKLVTLFASGVYLHSLETLEVRFCCRLENMFQEEVLGGEGSLRNLRSLYLLHVPKLKTVCSGFLPQLEKVRIRRCPELRKLPIQVLLVDHDHIGSTTSSLPVAEIRGEMVWWKNLNWGENEDDNMKRPAHFRPW